MRSRDQQREAASPQAWAHNGCSTGKRAYPSKKSARAARRDQRQRGGDLLSAYQCAECMAFHLGHMPLVVKQGQKSRSEVYGA